MMGALGLQGNGPAIVYNQDGSLNSAVNPAAPGSVITFYGTGEGQTSPAGVDGRLGAGPLPQPVAAVNVTIGGKPAVLQYAGGAPGRVGGLMHISAAIPAGIAASSPAPLLLNVGGA